MGVADRIMAELRTRAYSRVHAEDLQADEIEYLRQNDPDYLSDLIGATLARSNDIIARSQVQQAESRRVLGESQDVLEHARAVSAQVNLNLAQPRQAAYSGYGGRVTVAAAEDGSASPVALLAVVVLLLVLVAVAVKKVMS